MQKQLEAVCDGVTPAATPPVCIFIFDFDLHFGPN